jgi:hypothetical protein
VRLTNDPGCFYLLTNVVGQVRNDAGASPAFRQPVTVVGLFAGSVDCDCTWAGGGLDSLRLQPTAATATHAMTTYSPA